MIRNDLTITPQLVAEHGLKPDEYQRILELIGREPTFTELGIFSAMWNEHCSYKSSRVHLRDAADHGAAGDPGAGRERRRHRHRRRLARASSRWRATTTRRYIEPYQGAATGVGGILRDVFTMGARPIACLERAALRRAGRIPRHAPSRVGRRARASAATATRSACPPSAARCGFHRATTATSWSTPWRWASRETDEIFYAAATGVGNPDRLSRLQDRPRRHPRRHHGVGRVRRRIRGEAPDRAGRRSLRREAAARGLPRADGDRMPSSPSRTWARRG